MKGGHLAGDAVDVLAEGERTCAFVSPRIGAELRGTGDLLAVTLAACLANGAPVGEAIARARHRVRAAIARGTPFAGTRVAAFPV